MKEIKIPIINLMLGCFVCFTSGYITALFLC